MEAMRDAQNNKQGALRIYADVCLRILLRVIISLNSTR
jgi:hypothetical protein